MYGLKFPLCFPFWPWWYSKQKTNCTVAFECDLRCRVVLSFYVKRPYLGASQLVIRKSHLRQNLIFISRWIRERDVSSWSGHEWLIGCVNIWLNQMGSNNLKLWKDAFSLFCQQLTILIFHFTTKESKINGKFKTNIIYI